jgi:hypothetical protein
MLACTAAMPAWTLTPGLVHLMLKVICQQCMLALRFKLCCCSVWLLTCWPEVLLVRPAVL